MDATVRYMSRGQAPAAARHAVADDAGTAAAAVHVARDTALLAAHARGLAPDTLVFHRFPPTVSLGRHQLREREARLDYCQGAGIAVSRRPTAGGALYLDEGQQCLSLVMSSDRLGPTVARRLEAGAKLIAAGLNRLGVAVEFKPPNDLQVAGRRKIASVFLVEEGGSSLLFASVIAELDLAAAMKALLVPTEKLTVTGLEHARERMTALGEILGKVPAAAVIQSALGKAIGEGLGLSLAPGPVATPAQPVAASEDEPWTAEGTSFETKDKVAGATLRALITVTSDTRVSRLRFATDGQFAPCSRLEELAARLEGARLGDIASLSAHWLATHRLDAAGFAAEDIVRLVERAAAKWTLQESLGLSPAQTSGLMLAGDGRDPAHALATASVMLVPYCAKPNWCKWRQTIDCVECGECEVGDAYTLARARNMEVITITNFEHLSETLARMKSAGVESYVGMCCGEFFLKRHHAFRDSGMDAVLLDIEGATCYELKEEHLAYAGAFTAEAKLDLDAVSKLMARVPARPAAERPCITGIARRPGESRSKSECAACRCVSVKQES
jgi:lipoate---protein ligase